MLEVEEKTYEGWLLCPSCEDMYHEIESNIDLCVCPRCNHHFMMPTSKRINLIADDDTFVELFKEHEAEDLLGFVDQKSYVDRLKEAAKRTGQKAAVCVGTCTVEGEEIALSIMDFAFMGGSLGRAEGERITSLIEYATKKRLPLVMVNASGGARMQESMYSLMQMAKTSQALKKHQQEGLFYLSLLTHPTMGGVSASFAFLADVILAEPKALIGFTGPRVIEQTIGQKLKKSDQSAEFQLEAGMIDQIVYRKDLKKKIHYFVRMFQKGVEGEL
ncbi:MAG: Acetyl-coenzyme A carboxylase carboxyl transferase subunit beta [Chlamydiia bacterium]|nr:Acetyl-coenzyme A carboxylase carboxyl transferase subunit beta [Chlamydiia bacterium]